MAATSPGPRWAGYSEPNPGAPAIPVSDVGPSYLVSARKLKRPASELQADAGALATQNAQQFVSSNFTPAPMARPASAAFDGTEVRPAKRHAASVGPHTGPWWMKAGPGARNGTGAGAGSGGASGVVPPPGTLGAAADAQRGGGSPLGSVLRLGASSRLGGAVQGGAAPDASGANVAAEAGAAGAGGATTDAGRAQWSRAVRLSASTIRPPSHGYGYSVGYGAAQQQQQPPAMKRCVEGLVRSLIISQ